MAQFARPISDISNEGLLKSTGTTLYGLIDETSYSDTDYIKSSASGDTYYTAIMGLTSIKRPDTGTVTIRYRVKHPNVNNNGASATGKSKIALYCGDTLIASWEQTSAITNYTTYTKTLTQGQIDSITNWGNLILRLNLAHEYTSYRPDDITYTANADSYCSWFEVETPNEAPITIGLEMGCNF